MNRYYYVVRRLYKKSQLKTSMKENWGDKIFWAYFLVFGISISALVLVLTVVSWIILEFNKELIPVVIISYILTFGFSIAAIVFGKLNQNEMRSRNSWESEIGKFNKLLVEYKFEESDIERMILYIDEDIQKESDKKRRKYDVFWGFISVTIISLGISIGQSIWDSYGFSGDLALSKGARVLLVATVGIFFFLFILSMAYDSIIIKRGEDEKVKTALQEVLFYRKVEISVTVKREIDVLIEDVD